MQLIQPCSTDYQAIRTSWRGQVISDDQWKRTHSSGEEQGEALGYFVTSGTLNGYAKPSRRDISPMPVPRAAHEKICADLAYDLGLPLPPVILHRWTTPPEGDECNVALSLIPFHTPHRWRVVVTVPDFCIKAKQELRTVSSALAAFDTWVDNRDRANDGNLVVSRCKVDDDETTRVAYIDYSYSMSYTWGSSGYGTVSSIPVYPIEKQDADRSVIFEIVERIERLAESEIVAIVERIDSDFLSADQKKLIVEGLLHRRALIRGVLSTDYGVLP